MQELHKQTPASHPDYENLTKAIAQVQHVAEIINERKRESERFNAIITLQSKIVGAPMAIAVSDRHLLVEGEVSEVTEFGKRKTRYAYLFNDGLVVTQPQRGRFSEKVVYEYRWHTVPDAFGGDEGNLAIRVDERHVLYAPSREEWGRWVQALESRRAVKRDAANNKPRLRFAIQLDPRADVDTKVNYCRHY